MTQNNNAAFVIAVTGGIASGKSTLIQHIENLGFPVIDADLISKELTMDNSPVLKEISEKIGKEYVHKNKLNRKALGKAVFSNVETRLKLNSIMHPLIYIEIKKQIDCLSSKTKTPIFLDIPLLFEYHFYDLADEVWTVDVSEQVQLKRLMVRDSYSEEEAKKRIDSQISQEERNRRSNYIIDNNGSIDEMLNRVDRMIMERGFLVDVTPQTI